jgi:hypothetical protein
MSGNWLRMFYIRLRTHQHGVSAWGHYQPLSIQPSERLLSGAKRSFLHSAYCEIEHNLGPDQLETAKLCLARLAARGLST